MLSEEIKSIFAALDRTDPDLEHEMDELREREVKALSRNIEETVRFLDNDCSGSGFVWLSEIFEDVVRATRSRDLIAALYRAAERFPDECRTYNIISFIKDAEAHLNYLEDEEPLTL